MPSHTDTMVAVLTAATAIVGLSLVTLAVVASISVSLPSTAPNDARDRYNRPILALLGVFLVGLLTVASGVWWFVDGNDWDDLYNATIVLFAIQLATLAGVTTVVSILVTKYRP